MPQAMEDENLNNFWTQRILSLHYPFFIHYIMTNYLWSIINKSLQLINLEKDQEVP